MVDTPDSTDPNASSTVVTPTSGQLEAWQNLERYTAAAGDSLNNVGIIGSTVSTVLSGLKDHLSKAGLSLDGLADSSSQAARQTSLLTTAFIGAREAFTSIGNVDTSRLSTTTEQISDLLGILKAGPGTQAAASAIEALTGSMKSLGASAETVKKTQEEAKKGVVSTAMAFFTSADNVKRLQNSMIQMTTSGSGLGSLLKEVGDDFEKLDQVNQKYANTLNKVSKELGGTLKAQERAATYMSIVNQMPGGLEILTNSVLKNGEQFNILSDTLGIAAASGRKEEEVLGDINTVLQQYKGALDNSADSAKIATEFTARMAVASSDLKANIKDIQGALMESASAFKMFVMDGANANDMTKGMAESMTNYVSSLEAVGVPAANAIEMFKNYTNVVKNMSLGQMSFISSMSGGPGGLRGAFKIQDEIAKGNFEQLRKQMETTLKRTGGGQIVSREQAMQSEAAAAQYARQIQMVQQGPLGSMAKSLPEAEALLKAMKEGKQLPSTEARKAEDPMKSMNDVMKAGTKIQKDSHGVLVDINSSLNTIVLQSGLANRRTEREMLGTGNTGAYGGGIDGTGRGINPGGPNTIRPASSEIQRIDDVMKDLPSTLKGVWDSFKEAVKSGNNQSVKEANDRMLAAIKDQRAAWSTLTEEQKKAVTTAQQSFSAIKPSTQEVPLPPGIKPATPAQTQTRAADSVTPRQNYTRAPATNTRAGQQMPAPLPPSSTAAPSTRAAGGQNTTMNNTGGQAVPVTLAPGSSITVNFTGVCPHCGENVRHQTNTGISQTADKR